MEILDTAGQDEYTPLRETFMHTGDGFLLVYSITDDQTLEELRGIREQILRVHRDRKVSHLQKRTELLKSGAGGEMGQCKMCFSFKFPFLPWLFYFHCVP